jgi:hypothetical protein
MVNRTERLPWCCLRSKGGLIVEGKPNVASRITRRSLLATVGASGLLALTNAGLSAHQATPDAEQIAYLFVQAGFRSGTFQPAEDVEGGFLLTLEGAPAQTVFFSDRPARIAGSIPTAELLETLDFDGNDPPNAALVLQGTDGGTDIVVLELSRPKYDPAAGTLTYVVLPIEDERLDASDVGFTEAPVTIESIGAEFGPGSLFIDSLLGCNWGDTHNC